MKTKILKPILALILTITFIINPYSTYATPYATPSVTGSGEYATSGVTDGEPSATPGTIEPEPEAYEPIAPLAMEIAPLAAPAGTTAMTAAEMATYFTYTGSYEGYWYYDGSVRKWFVMLLTDGTYTPKFTLKADVFLVGGGASGGTVPYKADNGSYGSGGGGGGYTITYKNVIVSTAISVTIGAGGSASDGSATYFGSYSAQGGTRNKDFYERGGNGGSGGGAGIGGPYSVRLTSGSGGSNGSNGSGAYKDGTGALWAGGVGQGTTTYAFGGDKAPFNTMLYAGGGAGGAYNTASGGAAIGSAGAGGGGAGSLNGSAGSAGVDNTGGGGGGAAALNGGTGYNGGSGIVIVRNVNTPPTTPGTITGASSVNQWSANTINYSWPASTSPDSAAITYIVEYALNNSGTFTQIGTSTTNSYTLTIPGSKPSNVRIRVKARDANTLESEYSTQSGWTTIVYNTPPTTPTNMQNVSAVNAWETDSITFTCGASSDPDAGQSVTYVWEVAVNGGIFVSKQNGAATSYTHMIDSGDNYVQARVRAFDGYEYSGYLTSLIVSITQDNQQPSMHVSLSPDPFKGWLREPVTITTYTVSSVSGLNDYTVEKDGAVVDYQSLTGLTEATRTYQAYEGGLYTVTVTNNAGRSSSESFRLYIDTTAPAASYSLSTGEITNKPVIVTLTAYDEEGGSGIKEWRTDDGIVMYQSEIRYIFSENGKKAFSVYDNAGNMTALEVEVSNIDISPPVIESIEIEEDAGGLLRAFLSLFNEAYKNRIKVTIHASDNVKVDKVYYCVTSGADIPNATEWQEYTNPLYFDGPMTGVIHARVIDTATNESDIMSRPFIVDNTPPTLSYTLGDRDNEYAPLDVYLTATDDDGTAYGVSGVAYIQMPDGEKVPAENATCTVYKDGTYEFLAADKAGHETALTVQIDCITPITRSDWENNQTVIDAILQATGKFKIEDVTYTDLQAITFIDLSANNLTSVPWIFRLLGNLKHLDLRGNRLATVPECVYSLTNLDHLDLSNNDLAGISSSGISKLWKLEYLDVSLNYLVDYECPLYVYTYRDAGNFTAGDKLDQYAFSLNDPDAQKEYIGNTFRINVEWSYNGMTIGGSLEEHRKSLFRAMYPSYHSYRPLDYSYYVTNGQIQNSSADYVQIYLPSSGAAAVTLELGTA